MTKILHGSENVVCLFVCMFVLGHTSIHETINWTERPDHATFSLAKSMNFPIFGNADTQSANHKIQFLPLFENYMNATYAVYNSQIPSLRKNSLVHCSLN